MALARRIMVIGICGVLGWGLAACAPSPEPEPAPQELLYHPTGGEYLVSGYAQGTAEPARFAGQYCALAADASILVTSVPDLTKNHWDSVGYRVSDGAELWRQPGVLCAPETVEGDTSYRVTDDGVIVERDMATGEDGSTIRPSADLGGADIAAVQDGVLLLHTTADRWVVVDVATGAELWRTDPIVNGSCSMGYALLICTAPDTAPLARDVRSGEDLGLPLSPGDRLVELSDGYVVLPSTIDAEHPITIYDAGPGRVGSYPGIEAIELPLAPHGARYSIADVLQFKSWAVVDRAGTPVTRFAGLGDEVVRIGEQGDPDGRTGVPLGVTADGAAVLVDPMGGMFARSGDSPRGAALVGPTGTVIAVLDPADVVIDGLSVSQGFIVGVAVVDDATSWTYLWRPNV